MIEIGSLDDFCAEMQRLGAAIEVSSEQMPHCGATSAAGYHVTTGSDGSYVFVYSERGVPDVVAASPDAAVLMERVFIEVTAGIAIAAIADGLPLYDASEERRQAQLSESDRDQAINYRLQLSRIQEELLGNLDPAWRQRQSERNAERLRQTKEFFSEGPED
ncbi:hypothetical protein [Brevundimonas sp.]|uniref:hypothetical protein n=1 Tax=Brevundimonas sp. TaxID=1871086 RepID=UPI002BD9B2C0|nr:hypothetical protein [Brevundimonas sp.]HWQ86530.1 hypothetical protein [Brevundimonas sp.]